MEETKKEITEKELNEAVKEEIILFLREHQETIVRRARARLRERTEGGERRDA